MTIILESCKLFHKLCLAAATTGFNKNTLNSLSTLRAKLEYCREHLPLIGKGCGRFTFKLSSKKVLKIRKHDTELQNETEAIILSSLKSKVLPKLYSYAPDFSWIEVELVRPLYDGQELENLIGIPSMDFKYIMRHFSENDDECKILLEKYKDNLILREILRTIKEGNLYSDEFSTVQNLGKNSNGHLVLLDTGFMLY